MWLRSLNASSGSILHTKKVLNGIRRRRFLGEGFRTIFLNSSSLKDTSGPFPNAYNPDEVESGWYKWWLDKKCFQRSQENITNNDEAGKFFSLVLPPPNVTGDLHIGHALTVTIQDALVRWHKANGYSTLWVPGYDHAGIATQVVVEKKIRAQTGLSRHQLGKTKFMEEANAWTEGKIESIRMQLQRLGSSLDWSQECFTLNKEFAFAVEEAFIRLYEEGLIQRENALVNWCCHLQSAISDIEVNNIDIKANSTYCVPGYEEPLEVGKLTRFAYRLVDSQNDELVVATSRPETIFGDVAVAVHPEDQRFSHWVGRQVVHPWDGRVLPVIADCSVDPKFGTGCVKITPGHDYHDFEVAKNHGLPSISIMDKKGKLSCLLEKFKGMHRFKARKAVIEDLKSAGLFRGFESRATSLPVCSRSGDIIEPMLCPQWYLDCSKMFSQLVQDIEAGKFVIHPEFAKTILLNWLSEKRKWCISRQLWWGHQIPAYFIKGDNHNDGKDASLNWVACRSLEEAVEKATKKLGYVVDKDQLTRDEDVLDTWFSSALFPLAALGWPKKGSDVSFRNFYPLSLMETGHDIIFFWVARMAVFGEKLVGKKPFNKVLLHGLIRDGHGRKMSKSLGNVINPMDVLFGATLQDLYKRSEGFFADGFISKVELAKAKLGLAKDYPSGIPKCGADALRFALLSQNVKSEFINLDISFVHSCSKFCNKIWQFSKFYLTMVEKTKAKVLPLEQVYLSPFDRWILHQLHKMILECNSGFESYNFHLVTSALRKFWHASLCDVYLEGIKPLLYAEAGDLKDKDAALSTLFACCRTATVALAPIMPFLAEELYHRLNMAQKSNASISDEPYPQADQLKAWHDPQLAESVSSVMAVAAELRQIKEDYGFLKIKPEVTLIVSEEASTAVNLSHFSHQLDALSRCNVTSISREANLKHNHIVRIVNPGISVAVKVEGTINLGEIIERLHRRQKKLTKELDKWDKTLAQESYCNNTPAEAQKMHNEKIADLKADLFQIESNIVEVKNLVSNDKGVLGINFQIPSVPYGTPYFAHSAKQKQFPRTRLSCFR